MASSLILSNRVQDARAAMAALIDSRALPFTVAEPEFSTELAKLAWAISDAMNAELNIRVTRGSR